MIPTNKNRTIAGMRKKPIVHAPRMTNANNIPEQIHGIPDQIDFGWFWFFETAITHIIPRVIISIN
jgi:hypothetical protein